MAEKHALINGTAAMHPKQIEAMNEVNLVSGDFEKQYREGVMEKATRRRRRALTQRLMWVALAGLVVWLLALTVLRELQLRRLRSDVRGLAADLLAASASVRALHDKIDNNKFLKELQILDDPIYADEEDMGKSSAKGTDSLGKLKDLTVVLEDDTRNDEDDDDDDDQYPSDDEDDGDESGDWYSDYDQREKIGKTNMVHLEPKDFTDTVVNFGGKKDRLSLSNIREIERLLNENPEKDIGTGSWSTVPVEVSKQPSTEEAPTEQPRERRSVLPDTKIVDMPNMVTSATDRRKAMRQETEELRKSPPMHTMSRTVRNSEAGQRPAFVAAHFHGNTSHLNVDIHPHYKGNGLVRVSHGAAHDVWWPAPWTAAAGPARPTLTRNGHLHVHRTGVYLVYAQIYYLDRHDVISWVLHRTNPEQDGRDTLLQCAQSSGGDAVDRPNSCFSASALLLRAGDRLAVRNTGGDRHSLMQPEKSFIGLVKLADADEPEEY